MSDKQLSFSTTTFDRSAKVTTRSVFHSKMDRSVPWEHLRSIAEPHYLREEAGRPQIDLALRLHIYFLHDPNVAFRDNC